jgi:hypothetical protein
MFFIVGRAPEGSALEVLQPAFLQFDTSKIFRDKKHMGR